MEECEMFYINQILKNQFGRFTSPYIYTGPFYCFMQQLVIHRLINDIVFDELFLFGSCVNVLQKYIDTSLQEDTTKPCYLVIVMFCQKLICCQKPELISIVARFQFAYRQRSENFRLFGHHLYNWLWHQLSIGHPQIFINSY